MQNLKKKKVMFFREFRMLIRNNETYNHRNLLSHPYSSKWLTNQDLIV